jgi:hypothetical protein
MKYLTIFAVVILSTINCLGRNPPVREEFKIDEHLCAELSTIVKECSQIKVGSTDRDIEKLFIAEEGVTPVGKQIFDFKTCPYIKVNVTFAVTNRLPTMDDKIAYISPLYLDVP